MVDIIRPDFGQPWAEEGERLAPPQEKMVLGWVQEMMPFQYENYLQGRQDDAILYLLQKGIAEYSPSQEYTAQKSVVVYQGAVYIALETVTGVLPSVNSSWKRLSTISDASGVVSTAGGGTGASTAAGARTNLGLGSIATATAPTSNGVVVRSATDTLISRSVTGTANNVVVTNGDGVSGNITVNVGSNVALLNTDSSWTSTGSIRLPSGSTSQQGVSTPGRVRFNLETDEFHGAYSDGWGVLARPASAEQTPITDVGNFYTSSNVEGALQEVGLKTSFVKDAILSYADYAAASAAAATLPDGQVVVLDGDEATGVVSGGSISEEQSIYKVADYAKIRGYTGRGTRLRVSDPTGTHWWVRRGTGTDNGGTILIDALGRIWQREYSGLVDVRWFGAIGDGVQDDTSAAQAAVYYAFSKGRQLGFKNGNFYITQIKLPQNSAEPVEPFYIIGENARILLKTTDVLFTTDGDFFYDLFVQNLVFVGEAGGNFAAIDTKVFDCGKLMRLIVDSCASVYVNTVFHTPSGTYAQSVYAHKFIYRRGGPTGYFLNAPVAFDVSFIDCLVEQSYNGLRVVAPAASGNLQHVSRVAIRGGAWESLFGTAIAVGPCYQFTVDNVYFEGNGTDINLSYNATEADHLAVTITNNDFYQSPADISAGNFNIIWGANAKQSYRTGGNKTNGRLHDITGSSGAFDFTGDYAGLQLYTGMNALNVRTGNSPVGRTSFKTKEADWIFSGNDAIALIPSLGAIEMGRIGNADLVNGKVVRPRIAFGSLNPQTNPAAYNNVEWCRGSVVHNALPSELGAAGSKYVITGWVCVTSGYGGSDVWKEMRAATGS